jgi:hypothetical protein
MIKSTDPAVIRQRVKKWQIMRWVSFICTAVFAFIGFALLFITMLKTDCLTAAIVLLSMALVALCAWWFSEDSIEEETTWGTKRFVLDELDEKEDDA